MKPVLFQIGDIAIPSYPLLLALGACLFLIAAARGAGRADLPVHRVVAVALAAFYSGLFGARLVFVVQHLDDWETPWPALFSTDPGGLTSFGALLAGPVVVLCCHALGLPLGRLLDSWVGGISVLVVTGRLGCFAAGCCYGRPTPLPWAVVFPTSSPATAVWGPGVAVHPTQLYEAGALVALAVVFSGLTASELPGQKFLLFAVAYSLVRFSMEFFRGDASPGMLGLTTTQWIALPVALAAGAFSCGPQITPHFFSLNDTQNFTKNMTFVV